MSGRVAVLDPDDDPGGDAFRLRPGDRDAFVHSLMGRRLEIRADGGALVARIRGERVARTLAWLRDRLKRGLK